MGPDRAADRYRDNCADAFIRKLRLTAASPGWHGFDHGIDVSSRTAARSLLSEDAFAIWKQQRDAAGRARVPARFRRRPGRGQPTEWERLRKPAKHFPFERRPRTGADGAHRLEREPERFRLASIPGGHRAASGLDGSDQF